MVNQLQAQKKQLTAARRKCRTSTDKCLKVLENSVRMTKHAMDIKSKSPLNGVKHLDNINIYCSAVQADLVILLEKINLSNRVYERALFARLAAMKIIEFIDDIIALIGRDLLPELEKYHMHEFAADFKAFNKQFSSIRKNNEKLLRTTRNKASAHKSTNGVELLGYIHSIDPQEIFLLGHEIIEIGACMSLTSAKVIQRIVLATKIITDILEDEQKRGIALDKGILSLFAPAGPAAGNAAITPH